MRIERPLETQRLRLRTLGPEDVGGPYLSWLDDPQVNAFLEVRFASHDSASVREFVAAMNDSTDNLFLGIFLSDDGRHIGNIKLGPINPHHARADIGIMIGDRTVWGKGLATEAIRAVAGYAFDRLALHKVEAGFYDANEGSAKAFARAGFKLEGRLREHWQAGSGERMDQVMLGCLRADLT